MNIFKTFTLTWWQTGVFKLALLAIGIAVGAYWSDLFLPYLTSIIVIAVITTAYVTYIWIKQ